MIVFPLFLTFYGIKALGLYKGQFEKDIYLPLPSVVDIKGQHSKKNTYKDFILYGRL